MKKHSLLHYFLFFLFFCCTLYFQKIQAQEFNKSLATAVCTDHISPLNIPEDTGYEIYACGRFSTPEGLGGLIPRPPLSPYLDF